MSVDPLVRVAPMEAQKARSASGVKPRRRMPLSVACGIVPTVDAVFLYELEELALAEQGVGEVEAIKFNLLRREDAQLLDIPAIQGLVSANSRVHMEWVTCSLESDWPWA